MRNRYGLHRLLCSDVGQISLDARDVQNGEVETFIESKYIKNESHRGKGDLMDIALSLDKMTTSEKISAMEALWNDLCKNPEAIVSPPWHGEILADRDKQINEGKATFRELDESKDIIRKATR
ncbi:MAG: addiction module protein [Candidatus Aminicenantes bacterium]|nr:addiction module protein [Candidatus Aminicenantes bacterium]